MKKYRLLYRPLTVRDLEEIYFYISEKLHAPKAAGNLLDAIEESLERITAHPFSCRVYQHEPPLPEEFRLLPVKNYAVFYVVRDEIIEVRRILYARRDLATLIGPEHLPDGEVMEISKRLIEKNREAFEILSE